MVELRTKEVFAAISKRPLTAHSHHEISCPTGQLPVPPIPTFARVGCGSIQTAGAEEIAIRWVWQITSNILNGDSSGGIVKWPSTCFLGGRIRNLARLDRATLAIAQATAPSVKEMLGGVAERQR